MSELSTAHTVLELLITKAAISSKPQKSTLRISHDKLMRAVGRTGDSQTDLVITISMDWDAKPKGT